MHNLLIIDDDASVLSIVEQYFGQKNYEIFAFKHGLRGLNSFKKFSDSLDVAILDIYLPGINGLDICHVIRQSGITTPILMLTQELNVESLKTAFDFGANDYLRKPFDVTELWARVERLVKNKEGDREEVIEVGALKIYVDQRKIFLENKMIDFGRKEFDILLFLARNRGRVLSRSEIIAGVWPFDQDPYENTIDVHICTIRRKLGKKNFIQTVFGIGYRLRE